MEVYVDPQFSNHRDERRSTLVTENVPPPNKWETLPLETERHKENRAIPGKWSDAGPIKSRSSRYAIGL